MSVGKVVKSVGFGTYSDISKIKTAKAIDIVKKTSSNADGRGTIIIANIAITKRTTLKSFCPRRKFNVVPTCCFNVSFRAITTLKHLLKLFQLKICLFYLEVCLKTAI